MWKTGFILHELNQHIDIECRCHSGSGSHENRHRLPPRIRDFPPDRFRWKQVAFAAPSSRKDPLEKTAGNKLDSKEENLSAAPCQGAGANRWAAYQVLGKGDGKGTAKARATPA